MRLPNNSSLSTGGVKAQSALHLGCANAMPADVDHVVDSASDPVEAVRIPSAAIPRKVVALHTHSMTVELMC